MKLIPLTILTALALTPLHLPAAARAESATWRSADAAQEPLVAAAGDRPRARRHARRFASTFAALSRPPGPVGERQAAPRDTGTRRVATLQPHYAVTHPWVQRPVAHAGWYVPPPIRPRPIFLIDRRPIIIRPHFHLPWRPWRWRPPRGWRSDRWSRW